MANADRERKRNPHRCECGSAFDVCYFDDRRDPQRDREAVTVQVACPSCGKSKTLCVPDGLAFDADGALYIGCCRPDRVYRLPASGALEVYLDDFTGEFMTTPTNLAFGGEDLRTLFLAGLAGWSVNAVDVEVPGHPLPRPCVP